MHISLNGKALENTNKSLISFVFSLRSQSIGGSLPSDHRHKLKHDRCGLFLNIKEEDVICQSVFSWAVLV